MAAVLQYIKCRVAIARVRVHLSLSRTQYAASPDETIWPSLDRFGNRSIARALKLYDIFSRRPRPSGAVAPFYAHTHRRSPGTRYGYFPVAEVVAAGASKHPRTAYIFNLNLKRQCTAQHKVQCPLRTLRQLTTAQKHRALQQAAASQEAS